MFNVLQRYRTSASRKKVMWTLQFTDDANVTLQWNSTVDINGDYEPQNVIFNHSGRRSSSSIIAVNVSEMMWDGIYFQPPGSVASSFCGKVHAEGGIIMGKGISTVTLNKKEYTTRHCPWGCNRWPQSVISERKVLAPDGHAKVFPLRWGFHEYETFGLAPGLYRVQSNKATVTGRGFQATLNGHWKVLEVLSETKFTFSILHDKLVATVYSRIRAGRTMEFIRVMEKLSRAGSIDRAQSATPLLIPFRASSPMMLLPLTRLNTPKARGLQVVVIHYPSMKPRNCTLYHEMHQSQPNQGTVCLAFL